MELSKTELNNLEEDKWVDINSQKGNEEIILAHSFGDKKSFFKIKETDGDIDLAVFLPDGNSFGTSYSPDDTSAGIVKKGVEDSIKYFGQRPDIDGRSLCRQLSTRIMDLSKEYKERHGLGYQLEKNKEKPAQSQSHSRKR